MRRITALAAVAALSITACGDDDEAASSATTAESTTTTTTSRPTTTTAARSPQQRFQDSLSVQLDFNDPADIDAVTNLAVSICSSLDTNAEVMNDDAPNDSPQTDTSVVDEMNRMALDIAREPLGDDVTVVVLGAMGKHLCPQHQDVLVSYINEID